MSSGGEWETCELDWWPRCVMFIHHVLPLMCAPYPGCVFTVHTHTHTHTHTLLSRGAIIRPWHTNSGFVWHFNSNTNELAPLLPHTNVLYVLWRDNLMPLLAFGEVRSEVHLWCFGLASVCIHAFEWLSAMYIAVVPCPSACLSWKLMRTTLSRTAADGECAR